MLPFRLFMLCCETEAVGVTPSSASSILVGCCWTTCCCAAEEEPPPNRELRSPPEDCCCTGCSCTGVTPRSEPSRLLEDCCCAAEEIPDRALAFLSDPLSECPSCLTVSLGFFSVIRIERPAQYLVSAVEYNVPDKECAAPVMEDACSLFRQMSFPTAEFSPSGYAPPFGVTEGGSCCTDRN